MAWRKSNPNMPNVIADQAKKDLEDRVWAAMQKVIEQAVDDAKRFTADRGTARSGKQGRIDTGLMVQSIVGRVVKDGMDRIVGDFGFLDRNELYFWLQTVNGFEHGASFIEPTFALRDAAVRALTVLGEELGS
jgi:hypothetical protein